jgi:hypothetical protein
MKNLEPSMATEFESSKLRNAGLILWPSFLAACLLEALVFAVVDPSELSWTGHESLPTRQGVYTIAFFLFWSISMTCCGLVLWLSKPERQVNEEAFSD